MERSEGFDASEYHEREVAADLAPDSAEFLGMLQHFYRGELGRATAWRDRLDNTTNWSVGIMATLITWAFSAADNPHYIILGSLVVISVFLYVETRRYRVYDIWRSRVRIIEENVYANAADPSGVVHEEWREMLADDLRTPEIKVPFLEALSRRLKRVYLHLLTIIVISWVLRIWLFAPEDVTVIEEAAIAWIPGMLVIAGVTVFYLLMLAVTVWPTDRRAMGEKRKPTEEIDSWRDR